MQRLLVVNILFSALIATNANAQTTAAAHAYGYSGASCLQHNEDAQTNASKTLRIQTLPNEYSYGFTAASALTIHGFAMFTKTSAVATSTPFTMSTAFYPENPAALGAPSATASATGSMTVADTEGWYVTEFASPVTVASGEKFWVSGLDSSNVFASSILGGDPSSLRIYWRRVGTTWAPTGIVSNPGIVLICESTPILGVTNTPKIPSTNFSIDLSNGPTLSLCNLLLGISNTTGPLGALPTDLGLIGFTGTNLWCSMEFSLSGFTGTAGKTAWPVPIPATTSLDGFVFYVQAYTISTMTSTFSVSNAVQCTAGTL
jgi:hypothetical protein